MKISELYRISLKATSWMTLYMNLASKISKKQMRVVKILGDMLTNETTKTGKVKTSPQVKMVGSVSHFSVGAFFIWCYHLLWKNGITKPNLKGGLTLGFINGIIGAAGWELFLLLHPNAPKIPRKDYLLNLIVAHLVFGVASENYYKKIHYS